VNSTLDYRIYDDSVLDKNYSHQIKLVRRQCSGNYLVMVRIGAVNCLYVNPESGQCWIIDYRCHLGL
jgi:hypothetical protein